MKKKTKQFYFLFFSENHKLPQSVAVTIKPHDTTFNGAVLTPKALELFCRKFR